MLIKKHHIIHTEKSLEAVLKSMNFWVEFKDNRNENSSGFFSTVTEFMNQNSSTSELSGNVEEDKTINITGKNNKYWTYTEVKILEESPVTVQLKFKHFYSSILFGLIVVVFSGLILNFLWKSTQTFTPVLPIFLILIFLFIAFGVYYYLALKQKRIIQIFKNY